MGWEARTVNSEIRVDKYTVNDIFVNYLGDHFIVNRRYQRKLVWEIDEKRLLIDSILKGIPLPAILIAQYQLIDTNFTVLEIVDGMQRLNAIISFVLGEFPVYYNGKMCYFDPISYSETFTLAMEGKITKHDSLLPKEVCQEFYRYSIPVIITGTDNETIELIFSRINSTGRKISAHDLRQSQATCEFADLVRRIASRIRGDYTYDDRINLSDMPKISVGLERFGYGVDINTVFWRRHDLITASNMKESKDEEIIESLVATILLGETFKKSKSKLDYLYRKGSPLNNTIEQKILESGKDILEDKFAQVFDVIDMIFDSVISNFSSYIFAQKQVSGKDECFKILFLSIYRLLDEGFVIYDYKAVANSIKNASIILNQFATKDKIDYQKANDAVNNLYILLKSAFAKNIDRSASKLELEIDDRLGYSKIESQMTEFKIGISNITQDTVNDECIKKIAMTLVAMANTNNVKKDGYVIIGIANDKKSYDNWYHYYKQQAAICNQHYIPGVSCEAKKLFKNTDNYMRELRKKLSQQPISKKLKDYVLSNFELINYHEVEIVVFKSMNVDEISLYDGVKYVRQGNETIRI